jgi:predicted ArsR family transcriptional regulator
MRMTTTRQRVLAYIKKHQIVSAIDISRDLGMTQANARHHLAILRMDNRVEIYGLNQPEGRGRPQVLYGISRTATGNNLDRIADSLLDLLLVDLPNKERDSSLHSLAKKLAGECQFVRNYHITSRLALAVDYINEMNYHARWEAHAAGARIFLEQCPYWTIIGKHPELCQMDKFLLEELLGVPVNQEAKLETRSKGLPFCVFVVNQ